MKIFIFIMQKKTKKHLYHHSRGLIFLGQKAQIILL